MISYLASPYSHSSPAVRQARFEAVCIVAAELIKDGRSIFCPIAHTHPIEQYGFDNPMPGTFWLDVDRPMMQVCTALIIAELPGWEESVGIRDEIDSFMAAGKPVESYRVTPEIVGLERWAQCGETG